MSQKKINIFFILIWTFLVFGYSTEEDLLKILSGNSNLNVTNFTNGEINFNYTFLNGSF
jgi:hypothetical protein